MKKGQRRPQPFVCTCTSKDRFGNSHQPQCPLYTKKGMKV